MVHSKSSVRNQSAHDMVDMRSELAGARGSGTCVFQCGVSFAVRLGLPMRTLVGEESGPRFEHERRMPTVEERAWHY